MKRKSAIILIIALIAALLSLAVYGLFSRRITEKRYNKVMCYYIARGVTQNAAGFDDKIIALRKFVHGNLYSVYKDRRILDSVEIGDLLYGTGFCDTRSLVFMRLARGIGITSRLVYLLKKSGESPHTVAEVLAPDKRWVLVDLLYGLGLVTKDGKLASQSDIREDPGIILNDPLLKDAIGSGESCWSDPEFRDIYSNVPIYRLNVKGNRLDFLSWVPLGMLRPIINIIQNRYFEQIRPDIKDPYEFEMLKARGYHLLGYRKKSEELYRKIINGSNNEKLIDAVRFFSK
ncbi:MAG: transglutaminase family protein [Candidatus Omnitrophica bacterium]|nr:transglutaminase family protein [Candidatus Omnitrophota bacterium]